MNLFLKLITFLSIFIISCSSEDKIEDSCIDESIIDEFSVCIEIYQPVCGCDGIKIARNVMSFGYKFI